MTNTTPDMDLILPDVIMTSGPGYAYLINAAMYQIDSHDHSTGKGVQITPAGINISSDLSFVQHNATNLRSARLFNNTSFTAGASDKTCLYALNNELYYIDGSGNNVQITLNGALDLSSGVAALTIKDSNLIIENSSDTTKQFKFSAANLTTGTTYTFSLPSSTGNDTFVLDNATQTLTNKTLTSPVINTPTGITKADVGLGNVDNTSDATKNSAVATLTNKTMGSTNTLTGVTMASITPDGTHTVTFPTTTNTLATLAGPESLSNKTLVAPVISTFEDFTEIATPAAPSAGALRVYSKTDNNLYSLNSSGIEQQIGSGGSGSGINYISNAGFENDTVTGWVTYANTAQSTPVNGTGGSPSVTFVASGSSPLRGTYSGLFSKGASNLQGQGVSYAFTLASVDAGKTLQLTFDSLASAALISGDVGIYVYDITNSILISPSSINLPTGTSSQYSLAFQTTTSLSYRLIFHVATTNASAYTFQLDQMTLSPVVRPMVAGESDWIAYTPAVINGFGTVSNLSAFYKRIGDTMIVNGSFTAGTLAATLANISLPGSFSLSTTKLSLNNTTSNPGNIVGNFGFNAANQAGNLVTAPATNTGLVYFGNTYNQTLALVPTNGNALGSSSLVVDFQFQVPIAQWSSNITLASTTPMIEYVYNTSTSSSNDSTSFGYGAQGVQGIFGTTALSTGVTKTVKFQNPIQPTDRVVLEISRNNNIWYPASSVQDENTGFVGSVDWQGANSYGLGLDLLSSTSTTVNVYFGQYGATSSASYATAGLSWSYSNFSSYRWRVAKYSAIGTAELAPATAISTGTVSGGTVPGSTSGAAIVSGYIGEQIISTVTSGAAGASGGHYANATSISLTAGVWDVSSILCFDANGSTITNGAAITGISNNSTADSFTDRSFGVNSTYQNLPSISSGIPEYPANLVSPKYRINISTTTTYYLKWYVTPYSVATPQIFYASIFATRVG